MAGHSGISGRLKTEWVAVYAGIRNLEYKNLNEPLYDLYKKPKIRGILAQAAEVLSPFALQQFLSAAHYSVFSND